MKNVQLCSFFLLTFICGAVSAGIITDAELTLSGSCAPNFTQGFITDSDDYIIIFTDMNAISNGPSDAKYCRYEVSVAIPDGYQIAVSSMTLGGHYSVDIGTNNLIALATDYQLENYGTPVTWQRYTGDGLDNPNFSQGNTDSFILQRSLDPSQWVFSRCGKDVVFRGSLSIAAQGFGSFISLDQNGAIWDWQLRECTPNDYPARWDSTYRTANGQSVDAQIEFVGDRGTYTLHNGDIGTFSQVEFINEQLQGYWSLYGVDGWFRFYLFDDRNSFTGVWGYGDIGEDPLGNWSGRTIIKK
jgi:Domain of unknown function (DUF4360)